MKRPRRVLILGLPYFGRMLARLLRERGWAAEFAAHPGRDPRGWAGLVVKLAGADLLYLVSSRAERGSPQDVLLRAWRRPLVIHWVGTDVQIALEEHARGRLSHRIVERPVHWCDAPWLVDELATMGVRADHVPLPIPGLPQEPPPLPETFGVLLYLPVDAFDREVFDMETLLRLPLAFPEVRFILIPSPAETLPRPLPANCTAPGWVADMDALYREVSVVVRLTSHDGTSFMVAEALARGRQVIWTFPMEGAIRAEGFDAVVAAIRDLAARHAAGTLGLNEAGRQYVLAHFQRDALLSDLDRRLRRVVARRR
jgi:hypothetical protein